MDDRVDSGPRDRWFPLDPTLAVSPRVLQKVRRVGQSHTEKIMDFGVIKSRGAVTHMRYRPQLLARAHNTRGPSTCMPATWRPTRASAWPPATRQRHLRPVWATQALPRGLSAASHPEAVPRATWAAAWARSPR